MSKTKTEDERNNRRDIELPPNAVRTPAPEDIEPSEAEKILEAVKPWWAHILLAFALLLMVFVLGNYWIKSSANAAAEPWQQLDNSMMQFRVSQNVDSLKQMSVDFPNQKATTWGMLVAGDYELNSGLQTLSSDREAGLKSIEKSRESFQQVVDAPASAKTTMVQRRAMYSLAYAAESLGKFEEAKTLYQQLIDQAGDSIFAKPAQRGVDRCSDPALQELYGEFASYQPMDEEAPGAVIEEAPNVDFPEIDIPAAGASGEEAAGEEAATNEAATNEADAEEAVAAE